MKTSPQKTFKNDTTITSSGTFLFDFETLLNNKYLPLNYGYVYNHSGEDIEVRINQSSNNTIFIPSGSEKLIHDNFRTLQIINLSAGTTQINEIIVNVQSVAMIGDKDIMDYLRTGKDIIDVVGFLGG